VASTVAAAALTSTPSLEGFTDAFTVFTVAAAVAAVLSSDDYGSSVERGGGVQVLWRVHMRAPVPWRWAQAAVGWRSSSR
jgi:hypothetical protein